MQHTHILKFLTLPLAITLVCSPSFGAVPSTPQKDKKPLCGCAKNGQESQASASLQETLERTYMQNAALDAARAGLRAQDENVSIANADWRPSLTVQGTQTQSLNYPRPGLNTEGSSTGYQATIAQNIYKGGATVAGIGKAENDTFNQREGLFITEQNTLLQAIQAHTNIIASEIILRNQKDSQLFNEKILERAKARFDVGEGSRTDVATAEAEFEGATADVTTALGNLETFKATYTHVVGNPPGKLRDASIILDIPKTYDEALAIARANNPLVLQAWYAVEAAKYNVDLQFAPLLPEVDVNASVGNNRNAGTSFVVPQKNTNLQFQTTVSVPLYQQGIPNARVRQAYQTLAQQKVLLEDAKRQVVENMRTAWEALVTARGTIKSRLAEVKAREVAVEGATEEYNVGIKSIVDVFVESEHLTNARNELAQAQQGLIVASYQVLQAMGRLTACDLRLRVKYYDPDAYYNEYKNAWIQFWQGEDLRYVKNEDLS